MRLSSHSVDSIPLVDRTISGKSLQLLCHQENKKKSLPAPVPQYGKAYALSAFFCLTKINCIDFSKAGMYGPNNGK